MCKVVIRDVLLPLVARYGESIGMWRKGLPVPGYETKIRDERFVEYLEGEFHDDFKMAGKHDDHKRAAILTLRKEKPAELDMWIDQKLRKYFKLRTVIKGPAERWQYFAKLRRPRDSYFFNHEQAEEVLA